LPFGYTISESEKIVRLVANGSVNFTDAFVTAVNVAADSSFSPHHGVLVDLREMVLYDDVENQEWFVRAVPELRKPFRGWIAVVIEHGFRRAVVEIIREQLAKRDLDFEVFADLEAAERWLAEPR
jgi:hypothetical protein